MAGTVSKRVEITMNLVEKLIQTLIKIVAKSSCITFRCLDLKCRLCACLMGRFWLVGCWSNIKMMGCKLLPVVVAVNRYSFENQDGWAPCIDIKYQSAQAIVGGWRKDWAQALVVMDDVAVLKQPRAKNSWPGFQRTWLTLKDLTMDSLAGDTAGQRYRGSSFGPTTESWTSMLIRQVLMCFKYWRFAYITRLSWCIWWSTCQLLTRIVSRFYLTYP